jgi:protein-S-isoprenylcysteine O-methyltransferase Ste14
LDTKLIIAVSFSILYALFEFIMGMKQRRKGSVDKSGDKGSVWMLIISISIGYWLSYIAYATKIGRINHWNTFFVFGVILVLIGLIIRVSSIMTLKQHFTYIVTKIENHEVIEKGLYKIIRHPGYLGQLIIFTGLSALLSNWLSIILMMVPVLSGYIYRIIIEERFMAEQMGEKYTDYQKRTKRLIPMIY